MGLASRGVRVISAESPPYWNMKEWCDGFKRLIDYLELDKVHIFGASLGKHEKIIYNFTNFLFCDYCTQLYSKILILKLCILWLIITYIFRWFYRAKGHRTHNKLSTCCISNTMQYIHRYNCVRVSRFSCLILVIAFISTETHAHG